MHTAGATSIQQLPRGNMLSLNLGTSSQLALPINDVNGLAESTAVVVPYFSKQKLLTAASLNGGNVVQLFSETFISWLCELQIDHSYTSEDMLQRIMSLAATQDTRDHGDALLNVSPVVFGERSNPQSRGSVSNIGHQKITLADIVRQIHAGLIRNLLSMLPVDFIERYDIATLRCAIHDRSTRDVVRSALADVLKDVHVEMDESACADAAFGAAMLCQLSEEELFG